MNILFLSLLDFKSFEESNIYTDLLRELIENGNKIYCLSPTERRQKIRTHVIAEGESFILKQKIGNIQKVNLFEKGLSTLSIQGLLLKGIKKHFKNVRFDMVLYATPPITFSKVIRYIKNRDGARTYLMLKDIFPQNAVDLAVLSKSGIKGFVYKLFRRKEKELYALSDKIGCMSEANCSYLLKNNPEISKEKVEFFPNCISPVDKRMNEGEKSSLRLKLGLPKDKKLFVYGGNLGKPQNVPFIVDCIKGAEKISEAFFVVAGSGTDRFYLEEYISKEKPRNLKLFPQLPKNEYDELVSCCDFGLIFLDYRFTVPNFPSRLLSYMQAGLPVLACTDKSTDIGRVITEGGFGMWCESNTSESFLKAASAMLKLETERASELSWECLINNYSVKNCFKLIVENKRIN